MGAMGVNIHFFKGRRLDKTKTRWTSLRANMHFIKSWVIEGGVSIVTSFC